MHAGFRGTDQFRNNNEKESARWTRTGQLESVGCKFLACQGQKLNEADVFLPRG